MSVETRRARVSDIPNIAGLVKIYVRENIMLPRTELELAENIRDFLIAEVDGNFAGCGALQIYTPEYAEIRSLAVCPDRKRAGIGSLIVGGLLQEAAALEVIRVFAFTTSAGFFLRSGFAEVDRSLLPLKVWRDCLRCPKFHSCDEIAMLRVVSNKLDNRNWGYREMHAESGKILLPMIAGRSIKP